MKKNRKRMPTPADGLLAGSSLTFGLIATIVSSAVMNKSATLDQINAMLLAISSDENDVAAKVVQKHALRHLSQPGDVTEKQFMEMLREFEAALQSIGTTTTIDVGRAIVMPEGQPS